MRASNLRLVLEIDRLLDRLGELYEPEVFGEPGFVERCRREHPEMLPLLEAHERLPPPGGAAALMAAVLGMPGETPSSELYAHAEEYYLLRRMVETSGGDPGPEVLAELGLGQMGREFERPDAGRVGRRG